MQKTDWISSKIYTRETLTQKCRQWQYQSRKIVFTNGCFDILHRGHLDYLAKAAQEGNRLIIGLNTDASVRKLKGPNRPVNNEADRAFALASLLMVDAICLFEEETPFDLIKLLKPDVLVKGGDYEFENIVGAKETVACGGRVEVIPFVEGYSTTSFIKRLQGL